LLLAEDDDDSYLLFKLAWECAEIAVPLRRVANGEEAIRYLKETDPIKGGDARPMPCLVALDIKMPKRDGFEVLSWIRADGRFANLPTVMLSASGEQVDRASAAKLGANEYFVKPVSFPELVQIVRSMHERWILNGDTQGGRLSGDEQRDTKDIPRSEER
jgi:DNA-binding response OmpR family regulator